MAPARLSVVIPTHNRRELLSEIVASVLVERDVPLELIVVDDNSSDDTWSWLESQDDERVRPIRLVPGRGGSGARNAGLAAVTTPYVMFADDDDLIRPGAIPLLVEALDRHPEAIAAGGTYATFGTFGPEEMPRRQVMTRFRLTRPMWREQLWGWNLQPGAGVFRTEYVREIGGWDDDLRRCEDLDINLRAFRRPVALVPDTVLLYRQHAAQIDDETRRFEWALDDEVRGRFVAGLPGRDRRVGEQILRSRPIFKAALAAYMQGDVRPATVGFAKALRTAPYLARSPILGPWMVNLLLKSALACLVPAAVRRRLTDVRRARRRERLEALASSS